MTSVLSVRNLVQQYTDQQGRVLRALDGVSFDLAQGEVLGLVGESGCGKSTLARTLLHLPAATSGEIVIDGADRPRPSRRNLITQRRKIQMVFQDPFGSLNPRHRVGRIIAEPLVIHRVANRKGRVLELLQLVGLPNDAVERYPHEFSGGQRQRIAIARALALDPKILIADEPVSALDVSIQSQIINLIADLRQRLGMAMLFITHDLSVVRHVSDRIAVMYFGRIVEIAPTEALFENPQHPYTKALLSAIPLPPGSDLLRRRERVVLKGELPNLAEPPQGCSFQSRCPIAIAQCGLAPPPLMPCEGSIPNHEVACIRASGQRRPAA